MALLAHGEVNPWVRVSKADKRAVAVANRHYSRIAYGKQSGQLGPPGRLVCFATLEYDAIWVSHWPYAHLALDGLDAFRCTMFRNESARRASDLIRAAMRATEAYWSDNDPPADGWLTWIDTALVNSEVPGYCFRRAGWKRDRAWAASAKNRKGRSLIRLRSRLLSDPWPEREELQLCLIP